MKKLFIAVIICVCMMYSAAAQEQSEEKSSATYVNVPVYKVFDHKDAYVVMYAKGSNVGQTYLPKEWFQQSGHKKGSVRALAKNISQYMTIVYKDGEFFRVILNMPVSRHDSAWGVYPANVDVASKIENRDTLDIEL
ncbi:MAG: hypothetical protein NC041_08375 [Bacteroides sp.]|nr:hypothetical protein [Prevotella sp.]MCM1408300.1 hypothetical protein [Treponema brennaborense]MCM1470468.1 hypothetical protein [Bacteroides sp.]